MFQRHQQIRTQPAFFFPHGVEIAPFQEPREKRLGQVLGFLMPQAAPPNESIKRPPVSPAQGLQGSVSHRRRTLGGENDTPLGRDKSDR
jgi:hypothetical protein